MTYAEWLEDYGRAWEERDPEAAAALFTEDAVYRSSPLRPPSLGSDGVRDYWTQVTADQSGVRFRFGTPISAGNKMAVEWWTTMRVKGAEVTLPGCFYLRFAPDGRCEELREYWHYEEGYVEPPEGWGL